ncbi:MFS transporter [Acinetobacter qingfengensis]|uniref:MFS transporter n=1 Tax=Acinetobacter qingfengensis TaxID=1262585 RepID=A0A1E7QYD1_9GAMM|nr:MFS transporter [Acinetobacter qingfengensis]KAA8734724.1 MFS transporter [Acinetobacter qingfengensis]OEY92016.1 MFS transporter [Acinetobacter qingfengensis]
MIENKKPWILLVSIYTTQYMGAAFITAASIAIMRQSGMPLNKLALLNLIAIPIAFKILYAPFVDHYRLFFHGQYRSWLILAQSLMTIMLFIIGMIDIQHYFSLIIILFLIYSFAASVQDVAIDGLSCKLFDQSQRQLANGVQYSSNLLGNIIGGGVLLMLYPWLQWQLSLWVLAAFALLTCIQLLPFKEPIQEENNIKNISILNYLSQLFHQIKIFLKKYKSWFLILFIYPIGFTAVFANLNPMLVDAGWLLTDIGFVTKIFGSIIGIFSAVLAIILMSKLNRKKALLLLTVAQAFGLLFFIPISIGYDNKIWVYFAVFGYFIINPGLMATLSTIIMDKAATMQAKATFFTLQLSLIVFMGFVYAAGGMVLAQHIGYLWVIIISFIFALFVALLGWKIIPTKSYTLF